MILYMIQRKSDDHHFVSMQGYYSAHSGMDKTYWRGDGLGTMFRTPEGVAKNLKRLCCVPRFEDSRPQHRLTHKVEWQDYNPDKLKLYRVVLLDVVINGKQTLGANNFVQLHKLEEMEI